MSERREYELTDEEYLDLLAASKATPVLFAGGAPLGSSQQENANRAWEALGRKHGFNWQTVQAAPGKSKRHFTAEVTPPPRPVARLTDDDFRLLLDITMCLDPTPLSDEQDGALQALLVRESEARGYEQGTWTVAYHEHKSAVASP